MYVDVHTHLTHAQFSADCSEVIERARIAGLKAIVVNGLAPNSNRQILDMARKHAIVYAALGIYPSESVNHLLGSDFPFPVERFDVDAEIEFISQTAKAGELLAIGECGLDGYHLDSNTFAEQERVFIALIELAKQNDVPVIVHSRKRESRVLEILDHHGVAKANLHCYMGKIKAAVAAAEKHGWCFSIPAILHKSSSFQQLVKKLPQDSIVTETDAPYLSPIAGTRNEPANVLQTSKSIAALRAWNEEVAAEIIWKNFQRLFGPL